MALRRKPRNYWRGKYWRGGYTKMDGTKIAGHWVGHPPRVKGRIRRGRRTPIPRSHKPPRIVVDWSYPKPKIPDGVKVTTKARYISPCCFTAISRYSPVCKECMTPCEVTKIRTIVRTTSSYTQIGYAYLSACHLAPTTRKKSCGACGNLCSKAIINPDRYTRQQRSRVIRKLNLNEQRKTKGPSFFDEYWLEIPWETRRSCVMCGKTMNKDNLDRECPRGYRPRCNRYDCQRLMPFDDRRRRCKSNKSWYCKPEPVGLTCIPAYGAGHGFVIGSSSLEATAKLSKLVALRNAKLNGDDAPEENT